MSARPDVLSAAQQEYLDTLEALAVVVDGSGTIAAVNARWRAAAVVGGLDDATSGPGARYVQWSADDAADEDARAAAAGIADVVAGRLEDFSMTYPCNSATAEQWFEFVVVPLSPTPPRSVLAVHLVIDGRRGSAPLHDTAGEAGLRLAEVVVVCAWCRRRQLSSSGKWVPLGVEAARYQWQSHGICTDCRAGLGTAG